MLPGRTGVLISAAQALVTATLLETKITTDRVTRVTTEAIQEVLRLLIIQLPAQAPGVV